MSKPSLNPFPGLRPFTQEEDYLFFGREEQSIQLLQRLRGHRFVAVVGTSGSGKSSLVRCGLLSELLGGKMLQAGSDWEVAITHPGGSPLALLTDALLAADLYDVEQEHARENLQATLSRSHFGLVEAIRQSDLGSDTNLLLVVDQFEEIFRFHQAGQLQQEIASEFVSLLLEAVSQTAVPIYVVLTMRSDFIGECSQFEGLAELVNEAEFLIPRLTRDQYKRVIEGPVRVGGGEISPRLLQRLLNDLGQQADQLPCLQHALMRTWEAWSKSGSDRPLDLQDYQAVGRMAGALSQHADEIYEALASDRERDLARRVFQALTVQESETRGIRRPHRLANLCQVLDVQQQELLPIIDAYRHPGVTFLTPPVDVDLQPHTIIDISHESLMRVWRRLRQWVDEEAQAVGIYRRLAESAALHNEGKAGFYRDPELGIALAWQQSQQPNTAWAERYQTGFEQAMEYLSDSQEAAEVEQRRIETQRQQQLQQAQRLAQSESRRAQEQGRAAVRLRRLAACVGVVAVLAVIAMAFALVARQESRRNESIAEQQAEEADVQRRKAVDAQHATEQALEVARQAEQRAREFRYATDMQLVSALLNDGGDVNQALSRLQDHDPEHNPELSASDDLRGFEWHYFRRLVDARSTVFRGYDEPFVDATVTADGEIVGLDARGFVHRLVGSRGRVKPPLDVRQGRDIPNDIVALSPDGQFVALGQRAEVLIVDTTTGEESTLKNPTSGLVFSSDNKMLVTVGATASWWDLATGAPIARQLDRKTTKAGPVTLSADGRTLAISRQGSYSRNFSVFRMNPETTAVETLVDNKDAGLGTIGPIALSADGELAAVSAFFSGSFKVFQSIDGEDVSVVGREHAASISAIAFNPRGTELATASQDGMIKIWDHQSEARDPEATLTGHSGPISRIAFIDESHLVSTSDDLTTRLWDRNQSAFSQGEAVDGTRRITTFCMSADGQLLAVGDGSASNRRIAIHDAVTKRRICALPREGRGYATTAAFSPDCKLLAVGFNRAEGVNSILELWDLERGERLASLPASHDLGALANYRTRAISQIAFSPDGKYLVAGFGHRTLLSRQVSDSVVKVWDVESRREVRRLRGHESSVIALTFNTDGSRLATASYDGTVRIWDVEDWTTEHVLHHDAVKPGTTLPDPDGWLMVWDVDFSSDGRLLATAAADGFGTVGRATGSGSVRVWDTATGRELRRLGGHASRVACVAFAPNDRTLASVGADRTVRLWNVATWRELTQLMFRDEVRGNNRLAFLPDGSQLLAAGYGFAQWRVDAAIPHKPNATRDTGLNLPGRLRMLSLDSGDSDQVRQPSGRGPTNQEPALILSRAQQAAADEDWSGSVELMDQLERNTRAEAANWLSITARVRLAAALFHQERPVRAARLLAAASTSTRLTNWAGYETRYEQAISAYRISRIVDDLPADRAGLEVGDLIEKVNGVEPTQWAQLDPHLDLGDTVFMRVQRDGGQEPLEFELTRAEQIIPEYRLHWSPKATPLVAELHALVSERLKTEDSPGLRALRAELRFLRTEYGDALADYSAALSQLPDSRATNSDDEWFRLLRRRGDAQVALGSWRPALDDYRQAPAEGPIESLTRANQALAEAEIVLEEERIEWTVLQPTKVESDGGATLEVLDDNSVLAAGAEPDRDRFHVSFDSLNIEPRAIRLEALRHESLPRSGPGRGGNGNFILSEFRTTVGTTPLNLTDVAVSYDIRKQPRVIIDGVVDRREWEIWGKTGVNHTAVFQTEEGQSADGALNIELDFSQARKKQLALGRFRISVTDDAEALAKWRLIHDASGRSPWVKLAIAHRLRGNESAIDKMLAENPELARSIGDHFAATEDWARAVEIYSVAIDAGTQDSELLTARARAHEKQKQWELAAVDWQSAAGLSIEGDSLLTDFAGRLADAGEPHLATEQLLSAQELLEDRLAESPDNERLMGRLRQVLSAQQDEVWTALEPLRNTTGSGLALQIHEDNSLLVVDPDSLEDDPDVDPEPTRDEIAFAPPRVPIETLRIRTNKKRPTWHPVRLDEYQILGGDTVRGQLRGRYVRISMQTGSLPLAEVQVFAGSRNLALGCAARQSSIQVGRPSLAVDGTTFGEGNNRLTRTLGERSPWWEVDLGSEQEFDRIVVWNETDPKFWGQANSNYRERLKDFHVRVLNADRQVTFEQLTVDPPAPWMEVKPWALLVDSGSADEPTRRSAPANPILQTAAGQIVSSWSRFQVSASDRPISFKRANQRETARTMSDRKTALGVAYGLRHDTERSAAWFTRALVDSEGPQARRVTLEQAGRFDDMLDTLASRFPDQEAIQVAIARRHTRRGDRLFGAGQFAEALEELLAAREIVDELFGQAPEANWTVLTPTSMESAGGADLTRLADNSILVSGENPKADSYKVTAAGGPHQIRAIRLEALPHPSLPSHGPGRNPFNGASHLHELRITQGGEQRTPTAVVASYSQSDQFEKMLNSSGYYNSWATYPRNGEAHTLIFAIDIDRSDSELLELELRCGQRYQSDNLGRIRMSVSGDPNALARTRLLGCFKESELVELDVSLARTYSALGRQKEAASALANALEQTKSISDRELLLDDLTGCDAALLELGRQRPDDVKLQMARAACYAREGFRLLERNQPTVALSALEFADEIHSRLLPNTSDALPQPLQPSEITTERGKTLRQLPDGWLSVDPAARGPDTLRLTFEDLPAAAGLMLEFHPNGPSTLGRAGQVRIADIRAFVTDSDGKRSRLPFGRATAKHIDGDVQHAVDGSPVSDWQVSPAMEPFEAALLELANPLAVGSQGQLTLELDLRGAIQLARLRCSAIVDPTALRAQQIIQTLESKGEPDPRDEVGLGLARAAAAAGKLNDAAQKLVQMLRRTEDKDRRSVILESVAGLPGLFDALSERNDGQAWWHDTLAHYYLHLGDYDLAEVAHKRARNLYEQQLAADPQNKVAASRLADLLLGKSTVHWTPLTPVEVRSEKGALLEILPDNSVLARGKNPLGDVYQLIFETDAANVAALRLDALTHPSLPGGGPGRRQGLTMHGGFNLTTMELRQAGSADPSEAPALPVRFPLHDHYSRIEAHHWANSGQLGADHYAVYSLEEPIDEEGGTHLAVTLTFDQSKAWADRNLGRLRLSVTDDEAVFATELRRLRLPERMFDAQVFEPLPRLAIAYWSVGDRDRAARTVVQALNQIESAHERQQLARSLLSFGKLLQAVAQTLDDSDLQQVLVLNEAQLLFEEERYAEVLAVIDRLLGDGPQTVAPRQLQARALEKLSRWEEAAQHYRLVAEMSVGNDRLSAELARGRALAELERWEESAAIFTGRLLASTEIATARHAFAAQLRCGNTEPAKVAATWMRHRYPPRDKPYWHGQRVRANLTLAELCSKDKRWYLLNKAENAPPEDRILLTAAVHYRLGDLEKADELLEAPASDPLLKALAVMLLQDLGRAEEAKQGLAELEAWLAENREHPTDPKLDWADWTMVDTVVTEASEKLLSAEAISTD